jgi:hypothetical protein
MNLFLSGCYLANGSPSSDKFWVKDNDVNRKNNVSIVRKKHIQDLLKTAELYKPRRG